MSSVVVVDNMKMESPGEASKARYLERMKDLDLEDLACRQECAARGLEQTSLYGLAKGPLSTFLESQGIGNCRSDGKTTEIDNGPSQLQTPQAATESGPNCATS